MSDYKHTLNLPKTDFAMKANLANREPQALKRWYDEDYYGQIRRARARLLSRFILSFDTVSSVAALARARAPTHIYTRPKCRVRSAPVGP